MEWCTFYSFSWLYPGEQTLIIKKCKGRERGLYGLSHMADFNFLIFLFSFHGYAAKIPINVLNEGFYTGKKIKSYHWYLDHPIRIQTCQFFFKIDRCFGVSNNLVVYDRPIQVQLKAFLPNKQKPLYTRDQTRYIFEIFTKLSLLPVDSNVKSPSEPGWCS